MVVKLLRITPKELIMPRTLSLLKSDKQEIKKFIINNYLSQTWSMVIANIDSIFLGYFRNTTEVGFYRMSKNFYNLISKIIEPFYIVIYPELTKLWSLRSFDGLSSLLKKSTMSIIILSTPLLLGFVLFTSALIQITVGKSFLQSVTPTRILIFGAWVTAIFFWTRPTILAMGKSHIHPIVNFFNMVLVIALSFLLVPRYGFIGSAWIYVLPIVIGNICVAFFVLKTYREQTV
jgi:O-antigen/teichoic acid export membrane protein